MDCPRIIHHDFLGRSISLYIPALHRHLPVYSLLENNLVDLAISYDPSPSIPRIPPLERLIPSRVPVA